MPRRVVYEELQRRKDALRTARREASLEEKLQELVSSQYLFASVVGSRRELMPWEHPWDIRRDIRDTLVFDGDSAQPSPVTTFTTCNSIASPLQIVMIPKAHWPLDETESE